MLEERESVPDSSRSKEYGIEQIFICFIAIAKCLSSMEEERDFKAFFDATFAKPKYFCDKILEWPT